MFNFIVGLVLGAIFAPIIIKVGKYIWAKIQENILNK